MNNIYKIILAIIAILIIFSIVMIVRDVRSDDSKEAQESEITEQITQEESVGSTGLEVSELRSKLVGSWTDMAQGGGFILKDNGEASSMEGSSVEYTAWELQDKLLLLTIGTSGDAADRAAFNVVFLDESNLSLSQGTFISSYTKK